MTEAEAGGLLRNCDWPSDKELEVWVADQLWHAAPGGWTVIGEQQGWYFQIKVIPEALRLTAWPPSGLPETWEVLPR